MLCVNDNPMQEFLPKLIPTLGEKRTDISVVCEHVFMLVCSGKIYRTNPSVITKKKWVI